MLIQAHVEMWHGVTLSSFFAWPHPELHIATSQEQVVQPTCVEPASGDQKSHESCIRSHVYFTEAEWEENEGPLEALCSLLLYL